MLRKCIITDAGDSNFIVGEQVEVSRVSSLPTVHLATARQDHREIRTAIVGYYQSIAWLQSPSSLLHRSRKQPAY